MFPFVSFSHLISDLICKTNSDIRSSLSLGIELHRTAKLPILFLLPHHIINSYAEHFYILPSLRAKHQGQTGKSSTYCCDGFDGAYLHFSDSSIWTDGFSYGASVTRTHHKRASDWEIQRRLQSIFERLLQQLLFHIMWTTVSCVSITIHRSWNENFVQYIDKNVSLFCLFS